MYGYVVRAHRSYNRQGQSEAAAAWEAETGAGRASGGRLEPAQAVHRRECTRARLAQRGTRMYFPVVMVGPFNFISCA